MNPTRICLVRHGETPWNIERRFQGQLDIGLNATGLAQAGRAARGLAGQAFAAVYSSDLSRAMQTAQVIAAALGVAVQQVTGLRERHYGALQGRTLEEMQRHDPDLHGRYQARDLHAEFGDGESLAAFSARVGQCVEGIALRHAGESLLMVTHGGVLDIVYRRATGRDLLGPRDFPVANAALNWIEVSPQGWRLLAWAESGHLAQTLEQSVE